MLPGYLASVLLVLAGSPLDLDDGEYITLSSSRKRCPEPSAKVAQLAEIVRQRMPSDYLFASITCTRELRAVAIQFQRDDIAARERLMNEYCSAQAGWKSVAACGAGGPPPLCPVDHWVKSAQRDLAADWYSGRRIG